MKIGIMFANAAVFAYPEPLANLAQSAEAAGFESLWAVEHVVVPVGYGSRYPYSASGKMPAPDEVPIPDPIVALTFMAAHTSKIRLATGILILPQRHPLYVAKELASLDTLSKGRALLGVGIGWLEEEFQALGVPFHERAARTDESIQALRTLWQPGPQSFDGRFYAFRNVESNPKPAQAGGVPIVIGGHVEAAARRAARLGDGFFPARGDLETLARLLAALADECGKQGRDPAEVEISTMAATVDLDTAKRYEDAGVSRLLISPPAFDPEGLRKGLDAVGDRVIAKL